MPLIPTKNIRVENRFRKKLGDLSPLMDSITALGLLHPVLVNKQLRLIAGERRLAACIRLGWKEIPARIVSLDELRAEHDENMVRQDFLPSEAVAIKRALEEMEREKARNRMSEGGKFSKKGLITGGNLPPLEKGKTRDKLAAYVGMSYKTLQRAEEIVAAAEKQPEKYGDLLEEMDSKHRSLNGVYRKLVVRREMERLQQEPPALPKGRYSVIVADPPRRFDIRNEDPTKRNLLPYASMSIEEIMAMPVPEMCQDNCILFLWCTNSHLHDAFHVLEAWGFQYKTIMTWVKTTNGNGNWLGTGNWLRNTTEQVLVGVKGHPVIHLTNQTTHLQCPLDKRQHSRKPDEFYNIVESLCPQRDRLDLFARVRRDGWDGYGVTEDNLCEAEYNSNAMNP
jgi:N6-adenosine-specific RNA methylase IME4